MKIHELQEKLAELNARAQDLRARAEAEKRDLSAEEEAELRTLLDEFERVEARVADLKRLESQSAALTASARRTEPDQPGRRAAADSQEGAEPANLSSQPPARRPGPRVWAEPARRDGGFRSLGEMAWHVVRAARGGVCDPRLASLASASTYGSEGVGADGGFAVPPDFKTAIMTKVLAEDSLLSRCDQITVNGNTFTQPIDETTPWQTSTGILAYWDGEAAAATQSKPALEERTIKLHKLRALVPVTEELLEDASAMDSYVRQKAPAKISFKVNSAIVNGNGVGMPLGILNAPSLVTVSKESGQQANTLVGNNFIKMYSRLYGPWRSNAVWLINQEIEPQLYKLSLPGTDNTGNAVTGWGGLVYMPAGGVSGSPFGTIFGRPVIMTQACSALSSAGDVIFADLSQYLALLKSGPNPRVETSMHLWFDQDLMAMKFTLRMGGLPWHSSTITALNGSNTYSSFVTVEAR